MKKKMWRHVVVIHFLFAILRTGGVHGQQVLTTGAGNVSGNPAPPSFSSDIPNNLTSTSINSSTDSTTVMSTNSTTPLTNSSSVTGSLSVISTTSFTLSTVSTAGPNSSYTVSTISTTLSTVSPSGPNSSYTVSTPSSVFLTSAHTSPDSVTTQVPVSSNISLVDLQAVQMLQTLLASLLGYNLPVDQNVLALFGQVLAGNTSSLIEFMSTSNFSILSLINAFSQNGSFDLGAILSPLVSGGSISSLLSGMLQSQLANLPETFSSQCRLDIEEFQNGLNRLDMWTIEMVDAMGKPQAGMLKGQKTFSGQYDECREISHETQNGHVIQGQFCTPQVTLNFSSLGESAGPLTMLLTPLYLDVCLPASCTDADVFMLFESPVANLGAKLTAASCVKDKDTTTDAAFWVAIVFMVVLVVLCAWGTSYSLLLKRDERKEKKYLSETATTTAATNGHVNKAFDDGLPEKAGNGVIRPTDVTVVDKASPAIACHNGLKIVVSEPENPSSAQKTKSTGLGGRLLLCFSVLDNGTKLLDCSRGQADLSCLHGLRVISITWVVLGHCFSMFIGATGNTVGNMRDLALMVKNWTMMPVISGTLSVDTFFVISGCLTSYIFLRQARKGTGINCKTMALYYVHRFWRLTPLYMMSLLFYVGISPYLMTGPYDNSERQDLTICRSRWWLNLLYVNNIVEADKMCFGWSWYLANDMQFYVIAPLALLPWAYGKKIVGILVCLALVAVHIISNGVIVHRQKTLFLSTENGEYMKNVYYPPWTRVGPFFIGLLLGYSLHVTGSKYKIRRMFAILGWMAAAAAGLTCVYVMFDNVKNFYQTFQGSWNMDQYTAYETLSRPVWACAVAWVIFACCSGSGGFVNTFLSWTGWMPLSRLTYGVYLFHLITFFVLLANRITPFHASTWTMTDMTVSVTVLTFMVSFVFSLLVESPTLGLEKLLLGGARGKKSH